MGFLNCMIQLRGRNGGRRKGRGGKGKSKEGSGKADNSAKVMQVPKITAIH